MSLSAIWIKTFFFTVFAGTVSAVILYLLGCFLPPCKSFLRKGYRRPIFQICLVGFVFAWTLAVHPPALKYWHLNHNDILPATGELISYEPSISRLLVRYRIAEPDFQNWVTVMQLARTVDAQDRVSYRSPDLPEGQTFVCDYQNGILSIHYRSF